MSTPKRTLSQELLLRQCISQVLQNLLNPTSLWSVGFFVFAFLLLACLFVFTDLPLSWYITICMEVAMGTRCSRSDDMWEQVWECLTGTMIFKAMKRAWNSERESVEWSTVRSQFDPMWNQSGESWGEFCEGYMGHSESSVHSFWATERTNKKEF